jgi:uncharacterized protein (DUF697 family)
MAKDPKDVRRRSELIIHAASVVAGAAAASAVLPGGDALAIVPIQIGMVTAVCREHGIPTSESIVRSTVYAGLGKIVGQAGAGLALRWVPIAGNVVRASVAFTVTEAIGQLLLDRIERGGGLGTAEIDLTS